MIWDNRINQWKTDYGHDYRLGIPSVNRTFLIFLILLISIGILSYFNFSTGNYAAILEKNITTIKNDLSTCKNQTKILSSDLTTCNADLDTCDEDLSSKSSLLTECVDDKRSFSDSLSTCEDDLNDCENSVKSFRDFCSEEGFDSLDDLINYINDLREGESECEDDLDECRDEKSNCQNNYDTLKENYAEDYCCLLNQTEGDITHYSISNNEINCGTSGTALTC